MTASRIALAAALGLTWNAACSSSTSNRNDREQAKRDAGPATAAGNAAPTFDDLARLAMPMCDPKIESMSRCGDTMCPPVPAEISSTICTVNCCTPDAKCGTRVADTRFQGFGGGCVASATPDVRCPSNALGGFELQGCCDPAGNCGLLVANTCVPAPAPTGAVRCDQATPADAGH